MLFQVLSEALSAGPFVTFHSDGNSDAYVAGVESAASQPLPDLLVACAPSGRVQGNKMAEVGSPLVAFEVWSQDDFHPDDFLGQAELDLHKVDFKVRGANHSWWSLGWAGRARVVWQRQPGWQWCGRQWQPFVRRSGLKGLGGRVLGLGGSTEASRQARGLEEGG